MANGVNDGSEVVGSFTDSSGVVHGFTYKSQQFASLDYPNGVSTVANAINNSGEIVGYYEDQADGLHGFSSVKGKMTSVDFPTSVGATEATGVNNSGVVVGIYGQFTGGMPQAQGFVFSKGTYSTIKAFLTRKWEKELDYRLMKELWCFTDNRISVRFEYEWHDPNRQWFRTHGNEHWEFDDDGLMRRRDMSADDYPIEESERRSR